MPRSTGPGPVPARSRAPFAGRRAALDTLARCAAAAAAGQSQAVLVEGEPRIGKTTLVRRAVDALDGFTVVTVTCDHSERHAPWRLAARTIDRLGAAGRPVPAAGDRGTADDLESTGERLLAALGGERPLVLVVDDLHWADGPSADAFGYALRRLSGQRVLVVCTLLDPGADLRQDSRIELDTPTLTRRRRLATAHETTHELSLTGLDLTEFGELAGLYDRHVDPAVLRALHGYTAGHPGYASLLLADRAATFTGPDDLGVPRAFLDLVGDRLDDVGRESRRLAEGLSVLGGRRPLAVAANVSDVARPADALEPLLLTGLVRWWPDDPICPIEPAFPMLGAGIYRLCPPTRRGRMHRRAAALVADADASWRHRAAAADSVDARLAHDLEAEVTAALTVGDTVGAVRYLDWAAGLSVNRPERDRLMLTASLIDPARTAGRDMPGDLADSAPGPLRDAALGLWYQRAGEPVRARALLERVPAGTGEPDPDGPSWLVDVVLTALAGLAVTGADGARAVEKAGPVLARHRARDLAATVRAARADALGRLLVYGPDEALAAVEAFRRRPLPPDATIPAVRLRLVSERAVCLVLAGRHGDGLAEASRVPGGPGATRGERRAATVAAVHACFATGRWSEAAERLDTALADLADGPWDRILLGQAVVLAAGTGRLARAEERLARLAASAPAAPGLPLLCGVGRAALAQARGDAAGIVAAFDRLPDVELRSGWGPVLRGWWGPMLVEGLAEVGRPDEAERLLHDVAGSCPPGAVLAWLGGLLAERSGHREEALRRYRQGAAAPEGPDDVVLHRARLELALGRLLGPGRAAGRWLAAAHRRFAELGAVPPTGDAPAPPPVRPAGTGEGSLTGREREVADLVRTGLTNRQTAARLFISEKTVEFHLRNVYTKLGVRSRRELNERRAVADRQPVRAENDTAGVH